MFDDSILLLMNLKKIYRMDLKGFCFIQITLKLGWDMLILRLKKKGLKTYCEWLSSYKVAFKEILYEGNKFYTKDIFSHH